MTGNLRARAWKLALAVLLCCLMLPSGASAQDTSLKATLGFDGQAYIRNLTPVTVEVTAGDQAVEGVLSVSVNGVDGRPAETLAPVSLAPGARKRVTLYVMPMMTQKTIAVRLLDGTGRELARQELPATKAYVQEVSTAMIGVLGSDSGSIAFMQPAQGSVAINNMNTQRLSASFFPERAEALMPFGLIVASSPEIAALSAQQMDALDKWVQGGGVLIAGIGPDGKDRVAALSMLLDDLIMEGTVTVHAGEVLQDITGKALASNAPLALADLRGAGDAVLSAGQTPLVTMSRYGGGQIYIAAFDLSMDPLTDWPGLTLLFDRLLAANLPVNFLRTAYSIDQSSGYPFINALGSVEELKLPSIGWMLVLLAAYLILAVPVSYIILKRRDKREWMWLAVPAWALVFSLAIYGFGVSARGTGAVASQVGLVTLGKDTASLQAYVGIYNHRRGDVQVTLDSAVPAYPVSEQNNRVDVVQTGKSGISIQSDGRTTGILLRDLPMWTMGGFGWRESIPMQQGVTSTLTMKEGSLSGQVYNGTPWALEDAVIYTGYGYQLLDTLMPGQTVQVDIAQSIAPAGQRMDIYWQMVNDLYGNIRYGQGDIREVREGLLHSVSPMNTAAGSTAGCMLIAFTQDIAYPSITVNGTAPRTRAGLTLVQSLLDYSEMDGDTFANLPGTLAFMPEDDTILSSGKEGQELYLSTGTWDLTLNLSRYLEMGVVEQAAVDALIYYGRPRFALLNDETGAYDEIMLPLALDQDAVAQYVDAQGIMHLQITVGGVQPGGGTDSDAAMTIPSLTLSGRRD